MREQLTAWRLRQVVFVSLLIFHLDMVINFSFYQAHFGEPDLFGRLLCYTHYLSLFVGVFWPQRIWSFIAWIGLFYNRWFFMRFGYGADCFILNLLLAFSLISVKGKGDLVSRGGQLLVFWQASVIYFYTSVSKLQDPDWLNGKTITLLFNRFFSLPEHEYGILPIVVAIVVLALQLSFFLLWIPRWRRVGTICLGLVHLGIFPFLPVFAIICLEFITLLYVLPQPRLMFWRSPEAHPSTPTVVATI